MIMNVARSLIISSIFRHLRSRSCPLSCFSAVMGAELKRGPNERHPSLTFCIVFISAVMGLSNHIVQGQKGSFSMPNRKCFNLSASLL